MGSKHFLLKNPSKQWTLVGRKINYRVAFKLKHKHCLLAFMVYLDSNVAPDPDIEQGQEEVCEIGPDCVPKELGGQQSVLRSATCVHPCQVAPACSGETAGIV